MSRRSHAKHEHHEHHEHGHDAEESIDPSFGERHRTLLWVVVIILVVFGSLWLASVSLFR